MFGGSSEPASVMEFDFYTADLCCRVSNVDWRRRLHSLARGDLIIDAFTWDCRQHFISGVAAPKTWNELPDCLCCAIFKQLTRSTQHCKCSCLAYRPNGNDRDFVAAGMRALVIALPVEAPVIYSRNQVMPILGTVSDS